MSEYHELSKMAKVGELSNELTYHRYLINKDHIKELFQSVSVPDYIALQKIASHCENSTEGAGKTYLKELAQKMELPIPQASKMAGKLQDRGLIFWSHDGDGSEGTYVRITESGQKLMKEQEEILKDYYGRIIEKFGKEKLIQMLQLMQELETIMNCEFEKREMEEKKG